MADKESQADEVQALESIFSEEEFSSTNENGVFHIQFYAFITVPEDFMIVFRNLNETENSTVNEQAIKVRYLPPIEMYLKLPHNYPSELPPLFQLCCSWLSYEMLEKLCGELDRLWKENKGSEILFIWTQFMKEECLNFLEITDRLDLSAMYTRELINVANSKLTQRSSISNISEQKKDVEFLSNDNNNKVTATDNCDIAKRLPLDGIVIDSNVIEKSHTDSVCSSENSGQEMMTSGDSNKNRNVKPQTANRRREYSNHNDRNHNDRYSNSKSEHMPYADGNRRRHWNEKRRSYYDRKKENNDIGDSNVDGSNCDSRKVPFEKRRSNVIAKSFNTDTQKWDTVTKVSSITNQIQNYHETRRTFYDKNRKFKNDNFATETITSSSSGGSNDISSNSKVYNTYEFVNSKYSRHYPQRRYRTRMSKYEIKAADDKQNKESENKVVEKNNSVDTSNNSSNSFNSDCQTNTSLLVVNGVNSSLPATELPSCYNQLSSDKLSSSSSSQLPINNCKTCVSAESEHTSDIVSKTLHRSGQRRVYDRRIRRPKQHKKHLHEMIEDYNRERSKTEFGRNIFTCNICFANKLGISCTQFKPCEHVFCRECISGYIEVRIKEGTVQSINCPEHKCQSEASPPQVRELVSPDLFARYDHLLLSSILDTLGDIIYCPRSSCQYPVSKEENEKMAICPECKYVFCIYCKMVYHGVEPCRLKNEEKLTLIKEYQSADRETKLKLEQRYGKSLLVSLVENHMSETWIHNNSKNCPNCNTAIEKSDGCNKMVCWKCNAFFCWLCGAQLDPLTPYKHYYDTKSRCNNRLFEGIVVEENDSDNEENFHEEYEEEPEAVPFEIGYNMFVINLNLDPELENQLLVHIDNVD